METLWQVQLQGPLSDLEYLARCFSSPPRVVREDRNGGFLYESETFASLTSSEEVRAAAETEIFVLSGALKLDRGSSEPLRVRAVYRPNAGGGRDVFVVLNESVTIRSGVGTFGVTVTDDRSRVVPQEQREARVVTIARLARSDEAVAKAMRLLAAPDARSWGGLYRIHEVVREDVGGKRVLGQRGWVSAGNVDRFEHSANSVAAAGDDARHGAERQGPPKRPMSLAEADAHVNRVLTAWLASKGA